MQTCIAILYIFQPKICTCVTESEINFRFICVRNLRSPSMLYALTWLIKISAVFMIALSLRQVDKYNISLSLFGQTFLSMFKV